MQELSLAFSVDLFPTAHEGPVTVGFRGQATFSTSGGQPVEAGLVHDAITQTTRAVVQAKLSGHQVALPTLSMSLPHFVPEIIAQAAEPLGWQNASLSSLHLEADVPPEAIAPAAGQVMSGSEIAANVAGNFAANAMHAAVPAAPGIRANIGGMRVNVGPGSEPIGDQVESEIKDRILTYAIVGGVLLLVLGICVVAVVVKLVF
jgi:hypothetical protein